MTGQLSKQRDGEFCPEYWPRLAAVRAVVREHADATDRDAAFPLEAVRELRRSGLLGLLVPVEYGGLGGDMRAMLQVTAELARDCTSVGMVFVMHCQQVAGVVRYGPPRLLRTLLPRIARGDVYLGSVTTETTKGGHLLSSTARLVGGAVGMRVDRVAPVVTGGAHADGFLISMQAPDASSPSQVSFIYADREQLEGTVVGGWDPLGMRATHSIPMRLRGDIPADQVIGEHGRFREIAVRVLAPYGHLGWASCWLGAADGALSRTVRLLREVDRHRVGSELVLHRLSRTRQRLDTVHALIQHGTTVYTDESTDVSAAPVQLLLNAVKLTASEQCLAAVDELVELVGLRHGYLRGSALALERALRDLRSASLNYSNDRLHAADGALVLMDQDVRHA